MGHMKDIKRTTVIIASFAAILSLAMSFAPNANAGIDLTFDLNAVCGVTNDASAGVALDDDTTPGVAPGQPASGSFGIENTGTELQGISADVGEGFVGPEGTPVLHILAADVDLQSSDAGNLGLVAMVFSGSVGVAQPITNLGPVDTGTVTITAATNNLQNLPASGTQSATLTLTLGACGVALT